MIGDPSGRSTERTLNEEEVVKEYTESIKQQIAKLLEFDKGENPVVARNNYEWLSDMTVIDLLRGAGKHFGINYMLAKESVSARIEEGITYTRFKYMILESLDVLKVYEEEICSWHVGGSDQCGNSSAGMELSRRSREDGQEDINIFGLAVPLNTKAD